MDTQKGSREERDYKVSLSLYLRRSVVDKLTDLAREYGVSRSLLISFLVKEWEEIESTYRESLRKISKYKEN